LRAGFHEALSGGDADSASAAGDERDTAIEPEVAHRRPLQTI
jgi:hypothetical protein